MTRCLFGFGLVGLVSLSAWGKESTPVQPASLERPAATTEHPLEPVLKMAGEAHAKIERDVRDYTCTITRRERVRGTLRSYETINAKVRHAQGNDTPFSVYVNFLKPKQLTGREALFVAGENGDKLLVRRGGSRMSYVSTYLEPTSKMAMDENRYPITEIGFKRMLEVLMERMRDDMRFADAKVTFFQDAKLGGRACTGVEAVHATERPEYTFHRAVVLIDKQLKLPVGYAAYWWPEAKGGKPVLLEEYYYTNIKLNVGLTAADFDRDNPEYKFFERDGADPAAESQTVAR